MLHVDYRVNNHNNAVIVFFSVITFNNVVMYFVEVTFAVAVDDCSKDVRLPVQMQRAMAAEAEAAREAKAKV